MLKTKFTRKENVDSGLGLLLLLLILGLILKTTSFFKIAIFVAVITMAIPAAIYPFTFIWLNISDLLGRVLSKVILSVIFFIILCPVAFIRKIRGKDSLRLRQFRKSGNSVFTERNHTFSKSDLVNPF
jgi:hypothetical protein